MPQMTKMVYANESLEMFHQSMQRGCNELADHADALKQQTKQLMGPSFSGDTATKFDAVMQQIADNLRGVGDAAGGIAKASKAGHEAMNDLDRSTKFGQ